MWHKVSDVIMHHNLNKESAEAILEFVMYRDKFGIVNDYGYDEINNFHVNDFVAFVKRQEILDNMDPNED